MADDRIQYIFEIVSGKDGATPVLKQVDQQAKKTNKTIKTTNEGFSKLGGIFGKLRGAMFNFKTALVALGSVLAVSKIIRLAEEQEKAVNRLNVQLQTMGVYSDATSRNLQAFASAMQQVTVFGDEVILNQLAFAQAMGANVEQSKEIVKAAGDMSAALGMDLEAATRNVAKTLGGFAGELGEVIPELKELTTAQLQAGEGIKLLAERFKGAAAGQLNTFAGATAQLSNAWGDLLETFGDFIIKNPAVIKFVNKLSETMVKLQAFVINNKESITAFVNEGLVLLVSAIGGTLALSMRLVEVFYEIRIAILDVTDAVNTLIDSIGPRLGGAISKAGKTFGPAAARPLFEILGGLSSARGAGTSGDALREVVDKEREQLEKRAKAFEDAKNSIIESVRKINEVIRKGGVLGKKSKRGPADQALSWDEELKKGFGKAFGSTDKGIAMLGAATSGGAKGLVGAATSSIAEAFAPGIGGAVANAIMPVLMMNTEEFRKFMEDFFTQLPEILAQMITNIVDFLTMADQWIAALIDRLPVLVEALTRAMVVNFSSGIFWTRIAIAAISAFVRNIPEIVQAFIDGFREGVMEVVAPLKEVAQILEDILGGDAFGGGRAGGAGKGGFIGGILGGATGAIGGAIGGALGFAEGGIPSVKQVPEGRMRDSFPASLTSGELVVDRTTTGQLKDFLQGNQEGGNNEITNAILARILDAVSAPIRVETTAEVNQEAFARILIDLNRTNARVAV